MTFRRTVVAVAALAALLGSGVAPAAAHPSPIQTTPEAGAVAPKAPAAVSLALTEPAVARGSTLQITGPDGKTVATGPVREEAGGRILSVAPRSVLASAVYTVRWSALGADGHVVSGSFRFGVAGAGGADPDGAETLTGAGQRPGSDSAQGDGVMRWTSRVGGILAASFLLAGLVLLRRLRRSGDITDAGESAVLRFTPLAWLVTCLAAAGAVLSSAGSGASRAFDLGLLIDSPTGLADLVRLGFVVVASLALAAVRRNRRVRPWVGLAAAAGALVSYAFSGHALTEPSPFYLVVIVVHVVVAGLWIGGLAAVVLASRVGGVPLATALRRYAAIAVAALTLVVVTGVVAAVREVAHWYFLTWSGYGRVVIAKGALVAVIAVVGLVVWRRSRDGRSRPGRAVGLELVVGVAVLVLGVTLASLVQGRGRPLPAQVGTLFAGPATATAVLQEGAAAVGLAPGRAGDNVLTVGIPPEVSTPEKVLVKLTCDGCGAEARTVSLRRHGGRTWSAAVRVPADGSWEASVTVDGDTAREVALEVGVPHAPGSTPVNVIAVADLSGPAAERCRAHVIGVQLALARVNADGGLDGGRKVALLALDSGGTADGARSAVARALRAHPIASAGTCGGGGSDAVEAIADAGLPVVVGDPAVDPTNTAGVFRLASDPFAQGLAFGQLVRSRIQPAGIAADPVVRAVVADDVQGKRLLAGLQVGLRPELTPAGFAASERPSPKVVRLEPGTLAGLKDDGLEKLIDAQRTTALVVDLPDGGGDDVAALERLGSAKGDKLRTPPILLSERVLSESVVRAAGALGHLGALQGVSEVSPSSTDAVLYRAAVPQLFRGELASLDGLRGYAAGLALRDAFRAGTSATDIRSSLDEPGVFTSALLAPWSPRLPGVGSASVVPLQPQFLAPTLVPGSKGGEQQDDEFFPQGTWTVTSTTPLGLIKGFALPELAE